VIKTATLRLEVEPGGVHEAVSTATDAAGRHGGFILRSESFQEDRATLVLRVPSRRFEPALAELSGLGEVEREVIGGQDVGGVIAAIGYLIPIAILALAGSLLVRRVLPRLDVRSP
jgi:hypothetical protein